MSFSTSYSNSQSSNKNLISSWIFSNYDLIWESGNSVFNFFAWTSLLLTNTFITYWFDI